MNLKKILKILGPGLLYAGAAIGVSHLVQSTRAGANYGFDLIWMLILANILKYPFFEFAPRYAAATGKNLLEGYRETGKWALIVFSILTFLTMFTIQAAVTVVTAGITIHIFNINLSTSAISVILILTTMMVLIIGRYALLDKLIKYVILILATSTVIAVTSALYSGGGEGMIEGEHFSWNRRLDILFLIAFVGWMPAPIDVSVWHSLWTVAKNKNPGFKTSLKESLLDFKIGYIGTAFLAIAFLTLGAVVMWGSGEKLSSNGAIFADQLINMYAVNIGDWAYLIIAIAAFSTMYSTSITCMDAYPRVLRPLTTMLVPSMEIKNENSKKLYWFWIIVLAAGSLVVISYFSDSMHFMVDLSTTLSFITAPVLAFLNYKTVTHNHMPEEARPAKWLKIYAWIGMLFLAITTIFYLIWRFSA